jgi:acyl carrier protein
MADEKITIEAALIMFADIFEFPAGALTPDTRQEDIEGWDSLGVLTLMAELDSRFGVILSASQLESLKKIDDLINVLKINNKLLEH